MTTVKQLRNFLVLCDELHFARAAEKLGISQATLSNEIKKLESTLNFQLFDRSNRWEITLTDAGKSYRAAVKQIPSILSEAQQEAKKIARGQSGTLSIGISYFCHDYFDLGKICRRMQEHYPDVKIKIYDMLRPMHVASALQNGQFDIGFIMVPPDNTELLSCFYCKKICPIELMLCMSNKHPLANKKEITAADLKNCRFILPPREEIPAIHNKLSNYLYENCGTMPLVKMEVMGFNGISQMISSGLGIGFLPEQMIDNNHNISVKKAPFPLLRNLYAASDMNTSSQIVKNFMNLLSSEQTAL